MIEFVALRPKTHSYLMDDDSEHKKAKGTKKFVLKRRLKFNDHKDCLFKNKIALNHNKDFKMNHKIYILKKSIRLHSVVMMIKDCKLLIELQHIHMGQMLLK